MKKLTYFFDKSHLMLVVYPVMALIVFTMFFTMFHFLGNDLGSGWFVTLKMSAVMGLVIGMPVTAMVSLSRKSSQFWTEAEILEGKIDKAETQKELESLHDVDLKKLRSKAMGSPHYATTSRLRAIILTKAKYVKA